MSTVKRKRTKRTGMKGYSFALFIYKKDEQDSYIEGSAYKRYAYKTLEEAEVAAKAELAKFPQATAAHIFYDYEEWKESNFGGDGWWSEEFESQHDVTR